MRQRRTGTPDHDASSRSLVERGDVAADLSGIDDVAVNTDDRVTRFVHVVDDVFETEVLHDLIAVFVRVPLSPQLGHEIPHTERRPSLYLLERLQTPPLLIDGEVEQ